MLVGNETRSYEPTYLYFAQPMNGMEYEPRTLPCMSIVVITEEGANPAAENK
jgi:hypothetical protein